MHQAEEHAGNECGLDHSLARGAIALEERPGDQVTRQNLLNKANDKEIDD